jgi:hypothetical protein
LCQVGGLVAAEEHLRLERLRRDGGERGPARSDSWLNESSRPGTRKTAPRPAKISGT